MPKGLCYGCLVHFVDNNSCVFLFAMELEKSLVNDNIRATCKKNMSPRH